MHPLQTPDPGTRQSSQPTRAPRRESTEGFDSLVRQEDAAIMLGVTPRCMENWRHRGEGPNFVRISGRCIRYRKSDLALWIEARVKSSTSEA